jgi:hypothetical protein
MGKLKKKKKKKKTELLYCVFDAGVLNFVHHVHFMQCLQNAMNHVTEIKTCTAALRLASQIISLPSEPPIQVRVQFFTKKGFNIFTY